MGQHGVFRGGSGEHVGVVEKKIEKSANVARIEPIRSLARLGFRGLDVPDLLYLPRESYYGTMLTLLIRRHFSPSAYSHPL
jgi:hypothetical protein